MSFTYLRLRSSSVPRHCIENFESLIVEIVARGHAYAIYHALPFHLQLTKSRVGGH